MPLGKPSVFFSQRLNNRFFQSKRDGVVVEAGALDGMTNSVGWWFEKNLGWQAFNIEPNPISFALCELNRPACANIPAALSNESGSATLEWPVKPGHGSIAGRKFRGKTQTASVQTVTWNDFVKDFDVEEVDLLILDVEGHEKAVIEGMIECDVLPRVICAETNKTPANELVSVLAPMDYRAAGGDKVNTYFARPEAQ